MEKQNKKKKVEKKVDKKAERKVGRPKENKDMWRCVLRLPTPLAKKLKTASKTNQVSVNTAVLTVIEAWLENG